MNAIKNFYNQYKKALVAASGVVLSAVFTALMGGPLTLVAVINIIIIAAGAVNVAIAPNTPGAKYTKAILAGIAAAATLLISLVSGGISGNEWVQIAVAFLTAAGVLKAKNIGDYYDNVQRIGKHELRT
jgi:lysylphosphatidylglycerol synthetase-like protein (DUF2156 family)